MNILHVIRTLDPAWGGPVEGVKSIVAQAAALGHSTEITCLDAPEAAWLKTPHLRVNAIGPSQITHVWVLPAARLLAAREHSAI